MNVVTIFSIILFGIIIFFGLTTQILKNGEVIGTIRRQITFINDAFELEANEQDMPFLIALVIAIDNITDKKRTL